MNGILKRGVVIGLIAMFGSTACTEEKDDNTGLLLGAFLLGQSSTYSVTVNLTVRTPANAAMTTAADNRSIEFTPAVSGGFILQSNERIRAIATSGGQAGAGVVNLTFRVTSASTVINLATQSLKTGGNADLIADYDVAAGTGSFTLAVVDATPTALTQISGLTTTGTNVVFNSIRVVKSGTYSLESPTVAENICDGALLVGTPTIKTGNITANETWSGGILLQGTVNVTGATITVNPGTVVFGQRGSSLFFYNGGAISSIGTASSPICFTSSAAPGTRSPGDWGGLVLIGNGFNTRTSAAQTEGTTPQNYPGSSNSNSRFAYTVIEFAGNEVAPGDELNNLSMYAVDNSGTGPALDRVQTHRGLDDSFEWWGGNISGRFLVATGGLDDDFDADEGYGVSSSGTSTATLTSLIALKYPASCGGSFSTDPHSFEMDGRNSGTSQTCATATGTLTSASCVTNPTVSSFTIIGQNIAGGSGMRLREGMRGDFSNGLIWNFTGPAVECTNNSGFANSGVTVSNLFAGQSGAVTNAGTANCNTVSATLTALPITTLGNVAGDSCGFGATKPDFTTVATANRGAQATENTKWWEGWTVYRAR